jgi:hypothetical protein
MALCAFCNTETELYVNDIPICPKCDRENRLIREFEAEAQRDLSPQNGKDVTQDEDNTKRNRAKTLKAGV